MVDYLLDLMHQLCCLNRARQEKRARSDEPSRDVPLHSALSCVGAAHPVRRARIAAGKRPGACAAVSSVWSLVLCVRHSLVVEPFLLIMTRASAVDRYVSENPSFCMELTAMKLAEVNLCFCL